MAALCDWTMKVDGSDDLPCTRRAVRRLIVLADEDLLELGLCHRHFDEVRALPSVVEDAGGELVMRWT